MDDPLHRDFETTSRSYENPASGMTPDEIRAGSTSGHVRWVLWASVTLAVIAGVIVYAFFG